MKTLKDVLIKKDAIIALTNDFGFLPEVSVYCDDPSTDERGVSELILIVKLNPGKSIHFESPVFLETLLSEMLGCKVDVRNLDAIEMFQDHVVLWSAPIQDEHTILKHFGRGSSEKVFFDDTETPHLISLENARKHLASLKGGEKKLSDSELLSKQAVVCQAETEVKKRKVGSSDEADSPNQGSTESPQKNKGFGSTNK